LSAAIIPVLSHPLGDGHPLFAAHAPSSPTLNLCGERTGFGSGMCFEAGDRSIQSILFVVQLTQYFDDVHFDGSPFNMPSILDKSIEKSQPARISRRHN
jgi:hypothetical protein